MRIKKYSHRRRRSRASFEHWSWKKRILVVAGSFFGLIFLYAWLWLPSVSDAAQLVFAESTIIYDRGALDPTENPEEHILYVIHGDENREFVPLAEMSPWVRKATVAMEDDNFYAWWHFGFDPAAITKAVFAELGLGSKRGGSTITQQLVKNTFLTSERTYTRKFNELLLAIKMELWYSKDEILEMYLNKIPYGHNAHGIEAAARTFFGKSARDLSLAESAVLSSLPNRPTFYSPYGSNKKLLTGYDDCEEDDSEEAVTEIPPKNCEYKKGRKDLVLQRLLDTDEITELEFRTAWTEGKQMKFTSNITNIRAPHFVFYVRQQLEDKYGKEFLKDGGLRIYTTLDREIQQAAEDTIDLKSAGYAKTYGATNVALTAIDPANGQILAYVGGKNYFDEENDGQFDVLTSRRQPGSSFKPLVYATAFEKGSTPSTLIYDVETDFGGNYQPQNFNGEFAGPVTARAALNQSLNIPAIKMAYLGTPQQLFTNAEKIGIKIEGDAARHGVAMGIGVAEVEPLSHINSFQVFARDGSYHEPASILEIQNSAGKVLESFDAKRTRRDGLAGDITGLVRHMLTDETARPTTDGFDWNRLLQLGDYDNAAKTGTSNRKDKNPDFKEDFPEDPEKNPKEITTPGDSWTIGFTPHLVTGVWVGNNNGKPMKPGATGLTVAAPIWKHFSLAAHEKLSADFLAEQPDKSLEDFTTKAAYPFVGLETRKINKYTGKIATETTNSRFAMDEVFSPFNLPIELDDFSTLKSAEKTAIFTSLKPEKTSWENPVQDWNKSHPEFFRGLGVSVGTGPLYQGNQNAFWQKYFEKYYQKNTPDSSVKTVTQPVAPVALVKVISPQIDQKIPVNALFEARVVQIDPDQTINTVKYFINKNMVAQSNQAPFSVNISTENRLPGRAEFIAQVWTTAGKVVDTTVPIIFERERILQNQNPLIGTVRQSPDSIQIEVVSGARRVVESVRIEAVNRGQVFYEKQINNPAKVLQFSILKTLRGKVELKLYTKFADEPETLTSKKELRF